MEERDKWVGGFERDSRTQMWCAGRAQAAETVQIEGCLEGHGGRGAGGATRRDQDWRGKDGGGREGTGDVLV